MESVPFSLVPIPNHEDIMAVGERGLQDIGQCVARMIDTLQGGILHEVVLSSQLHL